MMGGGQLDLDAARDDPDDGVDCFVEDGAAAIAVRDLQGGKLQKGVSLDIVDGAVDVALAVQCEKVCFLWVAEDFKPVILRGLGRRDGKLHHAIRQGQRTQHSQVALGVIEQDFGECPFLPAVEEQLDLARFIAVRLPEDMRAGDHHPALDQEGRA